MSPAKTYIGSLDKWLLAIKSNGTVAVRGTKYRPLNTKIWCFVDVYIGGRLQRGNGELFRDNLLESFSVYGAFNLTS